ncbi:alpha/beta fold hydrolase [Actinomycetospora endophytica]|uniref:Alpha/beta fold hydrolase n=1 Tax=Actinomycetospora endophytica TaxID=2291215 RepID=A0ABS8PA70_9PSEU|nr:alpha/beta hydrolase [Actinomycetospora endophytica]MCD2195171.1 alpha/beta fold hydrolase [Actinomycetospora endophytica]
MRAREPDEVGTIERGGVRVGYEVFAGPAGAPTVLLLTSWAIVHMRQWKSQVPFLAREFRVVTLEGRGNGAADRPADPAAYLDREAVGDAVAVLDATGTERVVAIGLSLGARRALQLAAWHPERVAGVVAIGTALPWPLPPGFDDVRASHEGWEKANRHYWKADYRGWVEFFMSQVVHEPHSSKQWEDLVGWGLDTDGETLAGTVAGVGEPTAADAEEICRAVRCPVLVVHGDADAVTPYPNGVAIAEWTGGSLVTIPGGGHAPTVREPVKVNLLLREFLRSVTGPRPASVSWTPARSRPHRVLFVSSPIGLGHARRDVAIARELRRRRPDVGIDWLAQHPVTTLLRADGSRVHPASSLLAGESAHIEAEAGEHDLHAFRAIRRMDEILLANFHVFADVVDAGQYDLVVADEGWEIDHFLHENPELKRTPYAWLTDFVGWLPMPDGGREEEALTADYNAEMIEHVARYPRLRDRSIFVGGPEDLVTRPLGPGLPTVRDWTCEHFAFSGWVATGGPPRDRDELRAELGWRPGERVCLVSVGGSGVGRPLLELVGACYPLLAEQVAGLRMIAVAGPRIDPASLLVPDGVEVRGHVPDLERELTACDVAVVQGGLTTTMELAVAGRPFLYFPLAHHFEQQFHVPHRLSRLGAGRRMEYADATAESVAAAVVELLGRPVHPVSTGPDGAGRAADLLLPLLG